jgi:ABC-type Fe3+ transport system permease subunit
VIPDFISDLFRSNSIYGWEHTWRDPLWQLVYNTLNWDILRGGLTFVVGLGIAYFAVQRIRRAFGGE